MTNCCILGSGNLGSRIAGELALHGHNVRVYDQNIAQLQQLLSTVLQQINNLRRLGLISEDKLSLNGISIKEKIKLCRTLAEAVDGVDFIFEAVFDDLPTKQYLYQKITHICSSQTVIGSNTLNLKVEDFAEEALFSERILGIRFLYPVYCIPLIEYTTTDKSDSHVLNIVNSFFEAMGKKLIQKLPGQKPKMLSSQEVDYYMEAQRRQVAQLTKERTVNFYHGPKDTMKPTKEHFHGHSEQYSHGDGHASSPASGDVTYVQSNNQVKSDVFLAKGLIDSHNESYSHGCRMPSNNRESDANKAGHTDGQSKSGSKSNISHKEITPSTQHPGSSLSSQSSGPQGITQCIVCEEADINAVLLPCRHMWLCFPCAEILQNQQQVCPACRAPIERIIAVYKP